MVNEIGSDLILGGLVPRRKNLLPKEQPPRRVPFLRPLLFGVLLALRYRIHHVIAAAAQRRNLVEQRDIEGKPELVAQTYLIRQLVAQLPGRGRRICQQSLGVAVHEGDREHDGLLGLGRLQFQPARRLIPRAIIKSALQPVLAVRRVSRRTFADKRA